MTNNNQWGLPHHIEQIMSEYESVLSIYSFPYGKLEDNLFIELSVVRAGDEESQVIAQVSASPIAEGIKAMGEQLPEDFDPDSFIYESE